MENIENQTTKNQRPDLYNEKVALKALKRFQRSSKTHYA